MVITLVVSPEREGGRGERDRAGLTSHVRKEFEFQRERQREREGEGVIQKPQRERRKEREREIHWERGKRGGERECRITAE